MEKATKEYEQSYDMTGKGVMIEKITDETDLKKLLDNWFEDNYFLNRNNWKSLRKSLQ